MTPSANPYEGWTSVPAEDVENLRPKAPEQLDAPADFEGWQEVSVEEVEQENDAFIAKLFAETLPQMSLSEAERRGVIGRLAKELDLSEAFVERNFEHLQRSWEAAKFDPAKWRQENPELEEIILRRPPLAPVVMQDEKVGAIKRWWRTAFNMRRLRGLRTRELYEGVKFQVTRQGEDPSDLKVEAVPAPESETRGPYFWLRWAGQEAFRETSPPILIPSDEEVVETFREEMRRTGALPPEQVPVVEDERALEGRALSGLGRLKAIWMTYEDYRKQAEANDVAAAWAIAKLRGQEERALQNEIQLERMEPELLPRDYGQGDFEQNFHDAAMLAASQVETFKGMGAGGLLAYVAAAGPVLAATKNKQAAHMAGMRAAGLGAKAGAVTFSFNQELGAAVRDYRTLRTDDGQLLDDEVVIGAALIYAGVASWIEQWSFLEDLRVLGPVGEAFARGGGRAYVANLTKDAGFRAIAKKLARAWVDRARTESLEEMTQEAFQMLTGYAARSVQAGELQEAQVVDAIGDILETGQTTFVGSLITGAATSAATAPINIAAMRAVHRFEQSQEAAERSAAAVALVDKISETDLAKADPDAAAELVAAETEKTGETVTELYLDPDAALRVFQEEGLDAQEAAALIAGPDGLQLFQEAQATGGKVAIPVSVYMERIAGTPLAKRLLPHLTTRPGRRTAAQIQQEWEAIEKAARELAAKIEAEETPAESEAESQFIATLEKQLRETEVYSPEQVKKVVSLWRAFARVISQRTGLSQDALFDRYRLHVELEGKAERAGAPTADAERAAPEPQPAEAMSAPEPTREAAPASPEGRVIPPGAERATEALIEPAISTVPPEPTPTAPPSAEPSAEPATPPSEAQAEMPAGVRAIDGRETTIITPQRPEGERARYRVIEADQLIASHDEHDFTPNPAYPEGVQEREYHRQPEEQAKVVQGAQRLNPALLLSDAPTAVDGPPIVTSGDEAIVLGGNGRSMMIKRAFGDLQAVEAYRQALLAKAEAFGLDPEQIARMRAPVLVRVLEDVPSTAARSELVAAVRRTNEGLTQALTPMARAVAEARTLSPETVEAIAEVLARNPDDTLRDVMRKRPRELVEILRKDGVITQQNQTQWLRGPELTDEAKDRLEGMFLGRVIGTGDRMAQTPKSILGKLERVAPSLLRVEGVNPEFSETELVQQAIDLINEARIRGLSVADLSAQQSLFGDDERDPDVVQMAHIIETSRPLELAARFRAWANLAAFHPAQVTMFSANPTREEARRSLLAETIVVKQEQGPLVLHQPPPLPVWAQQGQSRPLFEALRRVEAEIRNEPVEHAVLLAPDGREVFRKTSNEHNQVSFSGLEIQELRKHEDLVFTHNHPASGPISPWDIVSAMLMNAAELRAVGADGSVWRIRRPPEGWPLKPPIDRFTRLTDEERSAFREWLHEARRPWERAIAEATKAARERYAPIVEEKGYVDDSEWQEIWKEEVLAAYNRTAEELGYGWRVEWWVGSGEGSLRPVGSPDPAASEAAGQAAQEVGRRFDQPAFHGTPHRFDRFSLDAVGSGEGTQFEGWGLYFSSRREVAEWYRETLTRPETRLTYAGTNIEELASRRSSLSAAERARLFALARVEAELLNRYPPAQSTEDAIQNAIRSIEYELQWAQESRRDELVATIDALRKLDPEQIGLVTTERGPGQVVEVEIPDNDVLLDIRAEVRSQPEAVRKALGRLRAIMDEAGWLSRWLDRNDVLLGGAHFENLTGRDVYKMLTEGLREGAIPPADDQVRQAIEEGRPDKAASLYLKHLGIPGLTYIGESSGERNFVIWTEEAIQVVQRYEQATREVAGPRGFMERRGDAFRIVLTEKADLSTFLHETAHVWLEILADLSEREDVAPGFREQWAQILDFLGVKSREEIGTEQHEKWAEAFEAYLMEGKPPSTRTEIVRAFEAFRLWLIRVYRAIRGIGAPVSKEVRDVFDRLIATDEEIENARQQSSYSVETLVDGPESIADEKERALWTARVNVQARILKERQREQEAWWKEEEKRLRAEAEREYRSIPARRAWDFLQGRVFDADGNPIDLDTGKTFLNRDAVRAVLGDEKAAKNRIPMRRDGVDPGEIAPMFGFASGEDLVKAIVELPGPKEWVDQRVQEMMQERYPDLLAERDRLRDEIHALLFAKSQIGWAIREWEELAKKARRHGARRNLNLEAIERAAELLLQTKKVRELAWGPILERERQAAQRAARLAREGNYEAALEEKEKQILNMILYRRSKELREELTAARRYVLKKRRPEYRGEMAKAFEDYAIVWDALRAIVGRRQDEPLDIDSHAAREAFENAVLKAEADEAAFEFDVQVIREILARPDDKRWSDLTVEEALTVRDALVQIRKNAMDLLQLKLDGEKRSLQELEAMVEREASERPDLGKAPASKQQVGLIRSAFDVMVGVLGDLIDPEQTFRALGPTFEKIVWRRYLAAKEKKYELIERVLDPLVKKWRALPKETLRDRFKVIEGLDKELPIPEEINLDGPRDRMWLLMVALNMGNESNRERLLQPFGWTAAQVLKVLNKHLTEAEWQWVQSIWDLFDNELWPEIEAKEKRVHGIAPQKIEPTEIVTPYGKLRGGYFPARYDPRASLDDVADWQEAGDRSPFGTGYRRAATRKSHTKLRAKRYANVVNLDWAVFPSHVAQVIHDVAFDEYVRATWRFLRRPKIRQILYRRLGDRRWREPEEWLRAVANIQAVSGAHLANNLARLLNIFRDRMIVGAIGWSATVAMADFANPLMAMAASKEAGGTSIRWAIPAYLAAIPFSPSYIPMRRFALSKSAELRNRRSGWTQQRREQFLRELGRKRWKLSRALVAVSNTVWFFMEQTDKMASTQIWLARYWEEKSQGKTDAEASRIADESVRRMLPGPERAEMPRLFRDPGALGGLMAFQGFFNKVYNIVAAEAGQVVRAGTRASRTGSAADWGRFGLRTAQAAGSILGIFFFVNVVGELLAGRGPEEDEEWEDWLAAKMAAAPFLLIPIVGADVSNVVESTLRERHVHPPSRAPSVSFAYDMGKRIWKAASEDEEDSERVWALVEVALGAARLPINQPRRTLRFIEALVNDEALAETPLEIMSGLVYGERDAQALNPFTLTQQIIDEAEIFEGLESGGVEVALESAPMIGAEE